MKYEGAALATPAGGAVPLVPLAVVGAGFRRAPTALRAALAALERAPDPPSALLRARGDGVVFVETCSRVDWIISTPDPVGATTTLSDTIAAALPAAAADTRTLHRRAGAAAVQYLLRVAVGLDSVVEGEAAVGRQLLRAFEGAAADGRLDRGLTRAWAAVQRVVALRRASIPARDGAGVERLVVATLKRLDAPIPVLGTGAVAQAVVRAVTAAGGRAEATARADVLAFARAAAAAPAVVVCTGGPAPWVVLPEGPPGALVIDVGVPRQTLDAGGRRIIDLDTLLAGRDAALPDAERAVLGDGAFAEAARLVSELLEPPREARSAVRRSADG